MDSNRQVFATYPQIPARASRHRNITRIGKKTIALRASTDLQGGQRLTISKTRKLEVEIVAKTFYNNWICRFEGLSRITTDQGRQFKSQLFKQLSNMFGITSESLPIIHKQMVWWRDFTVNKGSIRFKTYAGLKQCQLFWD
ncbi:hypothetical protein P5V15_002498 [Pogonomyrmex californicus]